MFDCEKGIAILLLLSFHCYLLSLRTPAGADNRYCDVAQKVAHGFLPKVESARNLSFYTKNR